MLSNFFNSAADIVSGSYAIPSRPASSINCFESRYYSSDCLYCVNGTVFIGSMKLFFIASMKLGMHIIWVNRGNKFRVLQNKYIRGLFF